MEACIRLDRWFGGSFRDVLGSFRDVWGCLGTVISATSLAHVPLGNLRRAPLPLGCAPLPGHCPAVPRPSLRCPLLEACIRLDRWFGGSFRDVLGSFGDV